MVNVDNFLTFFNVRDEHIRFNFLRGIKNWRAMVAQLAFPSVHKKPPTLREVVETAWTTTGIRCQAAEILADMEAAFPGDARSSCKKLLALFEYIFSPVLSHAQAIESVRKIRAEMLPDTFHALTLVWRPEKDARDGRDAIWWTDRQNSLGLPVAVFEEKPLKVAEPKIQPEAIRAGLLPNQKVAFDDLRLIFEAKRTGFNAAGIHPSFNALVIGMSGAGKTFAVRAAAKADGLPIFELSFASWMPQGSKIETPTVVKIAEFVRKNAEGVIFIDESDKLRPRNSSEWSRYLVDETMSLLDCRVERWDIWTRELADKLSKKFIILLAGAWQDAYTAAFRAHSLLGGTWDTLSIGDTFLEDNWLPDELLYRVCGKVIEIAQPDVDAIRARIRSIHAALGIFADDSETSKVAHEIAESRKGMRGVEEHLVSCWFDLRAGNQPKPKHLEQDNFPF